MILLCCVAAVLTLSVVDLLIRPRANLTLAYLLPVMVSSWVCSQWFGSALAALSSVAPTYQLLVIVRLHEPAWLITWNAVSRVAMLVVISHLVATLHSMLRQAERLAAVDHLTQLWNRRGFELAARSALEGAVRGRHGLTLVVLDVDEFKKINDVQGHAAGDLALRAVADGLRRCVRASDVPARLGGDEFVVLLPDLGPDHAQAVLAELDERLTRSLSYVRPPVRLSLGAVSYASPPPQLSELLGAADRAMYAAKAAGTAVLHPVPAGAEFSPASGERV